MPGMKRFALIALLVAAACENANSKLDSAGGEDNEKIAAALTNIEERLASLEAAHKVGPGTGAQGDAALAERVQKIEANLVRREEALAFLEMAYAQQKKEQDARDAGDPDPNAVFAVDISGPLRAGQVEGPNSALVTIVEAWDFA